MTATRISTLVLAVCLCACAPASALEWKDYLQTVDLYQGDAYGTSVSDIYLEKADPNTNKNGQGLQLNFGAHANEKNGYVRIDNLFSQIPEGSFIYKATLELTSSAQSTGGSMLLAGARGTAPSINQATATYNTPGLNRNSEINQLYGDAFGTTLAAGAKISLNITPSVRAWYDFSMDAADGYANNGIALNINSQGAGGSDGNLFFYDSENSNSNLRPHLKLQYLPPTSTLQPFVAALYQPTATDTAQVNSTLAQDAQIRATQLNNLPSTTSLRDNNFGGQSSRSLLTYGLDGSALLLRYLDLAAPAATDGLAAAEFRLSGNSNWNVTGHTPSNYELREVLKDWVEGTGSSLFGDAVAGVTFNSFARSDADPSINLWQTPGALGASDSILLAGNNLTSFQMDELFAGSEALRELVERWLAGDTNNGLMLRALSNNQKVIYPYNFSGRDPYVAPGLLLVFDAYFPPPPAPEPSSVMLLLPGMVWLAASRRSRRITTRSDK